MATTIFSWSDSSGKKSGSSSGGAEVKLSRSNGEAIPSNATITSVSWYARAGCSKAGTSSEWSFNRFKVDNTDTYPTLTSKSGESGSSSRYWRFYGTSSNYTLFQGKSSLECIFGISNSVGDGTYTSFLYAAEVTVNWEYSYDWNYGPTITSIKNNNDGEFTIEWSAASWQGGNTYVRYDVFIYQGSTYISESDYLTSLSHTASIPKYDTELTFYVRASLSSGSSSTKKSETTTKTFNSPTLSKPTISLSNTKGQSVTVTRDDSQVNDGSATSITYDLYRGSNKVGTFSGKTYSISQSTLEGWNQTSITFKIKATASGVKPIVDSKSTLTSESNTATFTFEPYKTICYYTSNGSINGYEECIVYYYTGDTTKGDNGWVECEPYYYTGDTSIGDNGWQICSYT